MIMEIASIAAIVAGPVFAVEAQRILDKRRVREERKLALFRTLMASRVARAADPRHTEALNLIGIEFYKEGAVVAVWRDYITHMSSGPTTDAWALKWTDLFVDLLFEMAQSLGFKSFDKTQIRQAYAPILYKTLEDENAEIRKGLLGVLRGKVSIPIHVGSQPVAKPEAPPAPDIPSPPMSTALPPYLKQPSPGEKL